MSYAQNQKNIIAEFLETVTDNTVYSQSLYTSELQDFTNIQNRTPSNSVILSQKIISPELVVRDGIARAIGLVDTIAKRADIKLTQKEIEIQPFAIEISESSITEGYSGDVVFEMLDTLKKQKDLATIALFDTLDTDLGSVAFAPETFVKTILDAIYSQSALLGVNQPRTILILAKNIYNKLLVAGTSGVLFSTQFNEIMAQNGVEIVVTTHLTDQAFLIEGSMTFFYRGADPSLNAFYTEGFGVLEKNVNQFTFSSNDAYVRDPNAIQKMTFTYTFAAKAEAKKVEDKGFVKKND